ncbi:membrane protein [Kushneria pakistanensis]|uniref:Membrane protein n=1 Tax=Kushneria pakistanensis TaxID=1508770 RepID=A0ABQ3FBW9_9GAMM|nr:putative holin [Kushneria pakistanensis]GHC17639.1 membrane protein [Kushneria pakistanensis]
MAEPSTTAVAAGTVGVTLASLMIGVDVSALIGAFAGASLFVVSARELSIIERICYLVISIMMGYLAGPTLAQHLYPTWDTTALPAFLTAVAVVTFSLRVIEGVKKLDISRLFPGGRK